MRTGAGIRNAFLFLILVIASHMVLLKPQPSGSPSTQDHGKGATTRRSFKTSPSTLLSDIRKAKKYQEPSKHFMDDWPPGPGNLAEDIPSNVFEQPRQRPYTLEDEERAALHRLVFSKTDDMDYMEKSKPKLMPDYSGLHMAAERSITSDLPMFYLTSDSKSEGMSDYVSGIESWGAGYLPVMT